MQIPLQSIITENKYSLLDSLLDFSDRTQHAFLFVLFYWTYNIWGSLYSSIIAFSPGMKFTYLPSGWI